MSTTDPKAVPHTVFFSIGDKNLKMTVNADSGAHAALIVREKLIVKKVNQEPMEKAEDVSALANLLDQVRDWIGDLAETIERKAKA